MKISDLKLSNESKYCTDKFGKPEDQGVHLYEKFYDDFFDKKKNDKLSLLEVGVQYGGSMRLFHDYLQNSSVYGVDIMNVWNADDINNYDRLTFKQLDGYSNNLLNVFGVDGFDIIIDDGPHTLESQIFAANNFVKYLNPGGLLIIEDVPNGFLSEILKHIDKSLKVTVLDYSNERPRWDDILILIEKKDG